MSVQGDAIRYEFRDFKVDGDPNSGVHHPGKKPVRDVLGAQADRGEEILTTIDVDGSATRALSAARDAEAAETGAVAARGLAEDARDLSEQYAGVVSRSTSVAGLTDPATLVAGDKGYVSGSGDDAVDGLYEVQAGAWVRVGGTGFAGLGNRVEAVDGSEIVGSAFPLINSGSTTNGSFRTFGQIATPGYLDEVTVNAAAAGNVTVAIMAEEPAGTLVRVGDKIVLPVVAGANVFTTADLGEPRIEQGYRLGFVGAGLIYYASGSDLVYTTTTADGGPMTSSSSTLKYSINFKTRIGKLANAELRVEELEKYDDRGVIAQPFDADLVTKVNASTAAWQLYDKPASAVSVVSGIRLFVRQAGTLKIRRYTLEGSNFVSQPGEFSLELKAGFNSFGASQLPKIELLPGEYLATTGSGIEYDSGASFQTFGLTDDPVVAKPNPWTFNFQISIETGSAEVHKNGRRISALEAPKVYGEVVVGAQLECNFLDVEARATLYRNGAVEGIAFTGSVLAPSGTTTRHDIVYFDDKANVIGIASGTERADDPSAFIPTLTREQRPLFLLRVNGSKIINVPLWNVENGEVVDLSQQMERDHRKARARVRRTLSKIRQGQPLKILGFGDSITALSGSTGLRDQATQVYLPVAYGADVISTIPLYTAEQLGRPADAEGASYTKIGWNWALIEALEKAGYVIGSSLTYDNRGTNTWSTENAVINGAPTAWLNDAVAANADLVVVALGMNERGSVNTEANMITIINSFKDAGQDVVVLDCPRVPDAISHTDMRGKWEFTNRAIRRAADAAGAAHLSLYPIEGDGHFGAMGITPRDLCAANKSNHPGLIELSAIGRLLCKMLLD